MMFSRLAAEPFDHLVKGVLDGTSVRVSTEGLAGNLQGSLNPGAGPVVLSLRNDLDFDALRSRIKTRELGHFVCGNLPEILGDQHTATPDD